MENLTTVIILQLSLSSIVTCVNCKLPSDVQTYGEMTTETFASRDLHMSLCEVKTARETSSVLIKLRELFS